MKFDDPELGSRGQSTFEFLNCLAASISALSSQIDVHIEDVVDPDSLPQDLDVRAELIERELFQLRAFRVQQLLADWHSGIHGKVAAEAFSEIEDKLRPSIIAAEKGPARLDLNLSMELPTYWEGVSFHRTGAWDSHPDMGYIHGQLVHKDMVGKLSGVDIFAQRKSVAELAPCAEYGDILEMGCSSGHFTTALAEVFPGSKITGVDLSARMLEHAFRTANANGWAWSLHQRNAENTGFADASFDLVTSYILLHELPASAVRGVFEEAFRVLRPGGDLLMSDVARFADLGAIEVWKAERAARFGGEPHWRASAQLDLATIARQAGFIDVSAEGTYPHVVIGRKPK